MTEGLPTNTTFRYIQPFYRDNEVRIATSRGIYAAELYDTPQLSQTLIQPLVDKDTTNCARDTFYFDDYSVVEHAGATWSWNFPGAAYVSDPNIRNPKVVFGAAGNYNVTMTITKNGQALSKTINSMVKVGGSCTTIQPTPEQAMFFDKSASSRLNLGDFNLTTNTFTFTAWIKPTQVQEFYQGIFTNGVYQADSDNTALGLSMSYGGNALYYRWPGTTTGWAGSSTLFPPLDEWSYVAMVMSPNKVTLYLNEEKWESNVSHAPADISQLYLGFGHFYKYFNGYMDEVTFWKKSLTDQEIRELMHLTKDPTNHPDLLAYYQFNEPTGSVLDKAKSQHAALVGGANRTNSTAPFGAGFSDTQTETNGNVPFGMADFEANFTNQSGVEVVASKINNAPYNTNGLATGDTPIANEYWAVHRYGTGDFTANLTFKTSTDISPTDAAAPSQYVLYQRGGQAEGDWTYLATATSIDAATNKLTFTADISEWGQFLIAKSTQSIIRTTGPLSFGTAIVGNTSTAKTYTVSAANLSGNLTITAPTGFDISTTSGSGFASNLSLSPSNGHLAETTIYVRFVPTLRQSYADNITHSSTGVTNSLVAVSGEATDFDTIPGTALSLDGNNDYVNLGNPAELQLTGDLTIQMWLKPNNFSARRNPIGKAYDGAYTINLEQNGHVVFYHGGAGTNSTVNYQGIDANQSLILNEWNHITAVRDMANRKFYWYINGIKTREFSNIKNDIVSGNGSVLIGEGYVNGFDGLIDEVRFWNVPLTAEQVRENMHLTLKGDEPGLVAYYQFNEPNGDATDLINGLNGTFVNDATRSTATEPVGGGFADTKIESSSSISFTDTDVDVEFTAQNSAEVVVAKINLAPNILPTGLTRVFDSQYWAIHRYGTGAFAGNITFKIAEDLTTGDAQTPDEIVLYGRNFNSDGAWTLIDVAMSVDASTDQATFNAISNFDQFIIGSTSDGGTTTPADCIADILYENRDNMPDLTSSTTYIKAGNLMGNGDATIKNGQNKLFRAKEYIQLMPGFTVEAGANFTAKIEDCAAGAISEPAAARTAPKATEPKTALDMNVYPNPFETRFFIDYRINQTAQVTIQLFDMSGQKVRDILLDKKRKAGTYQARFTNRNLTVGTYILMIKVNDQISQRKVVMSGQR